MRINSISLEMGRDGLVISLREAGFFDSGLAVPRPDAVPTLRQIAARLGMTPYDLRIEGHTDNVPILNAEFDSPNWELSSARAHAHRTVISGDEGHAPPEHASRPRVTLSFIPWLITARLPAALKIAAWTWS